MKRVLLALTLLMLPLAAVAQGTLEVNGTTCSQGVIGDANFEGDCGLETSMTTAGDRAFVQDDTPNGETVYRASFWFNPNDHPLGDGTAHFIFAANMPRPSGDPGFAPKLQLELRKRATGNSFRVRLASWSGNPNNPTRQYTGLIALTRTSWHQIQVEWQRSTSNVTADGFHRICIIGGPQAGACEEIANVTKDANVTVDRVQLGVMSGYDGLSGSHYFDSFSSFRTLAP